MPASPRDDNREPGLVAKSDIANTAVILEANPTTKALKVESQSENITGAGDGVKVVTTAGTDVVLAASTACKRIIIQAQTDNTNIVAVGVAGVDATIATGTGTALFPGDAIDIQTDNLADIYIDSLVSGEGVRYFYFT